MSPEEVVELSDEELVAYLENAAGVGVTAEPGPAYRGACAWEKLMGALGRYFCQVTQESVQRDGMCGEVLVDASLCLRLAGHGGRCNRAGEKLPEGGP